MEDKYRLSKNQKQEVAQNLIDLLEKDAVMNAETHRFIAGWILTDGGGKSKVFYDVWNIVLKSFLPKTRPILFRACDRISKNGKKEMLFLQESFNRVGEYTDTFYPLVDVLIKAKEAGECGFTETLLNFACEDEYIMRINLGHMHSVKWIKNNR